MVEEERHSDLTKKVAVEQSALQVHVGERLAGGSVSSRSSGPRIGWPSLGALRQRRTQVHFETLSDEALVARSAEGDTLSFGELYRRYVNDVFMYVCLRVHDPQTAEDLTQDIFFSAYRALPRFHWQGAFRPWLLQCAHNRLANYWRTRQRSPDVTDLPVDEDDDEPGPEVANHEDGFQMVDLHLDLETVICAMTHLSDLQREVLALRFGNELTVAETAAVMGRSETAVTNLQYYALQKLRRCLNAQNGVDR